VDIIRTEFSLESVITDTIDRYGPIITVGGDFSHTEISDLEALCYSTLQELLWPPHQPTTIAPLVLSPYNFTRAQRWMIALFCCNGSLNSNDHKEEIQVGGISNTKLCRNLLERRKILTY